MVYEGAFRVPEGSGADAFGYGGTAIAHNPVNNSLILTGHDWYQKSAEISIPALIESSNLKSLARATLLQALRDPFEGRVGQINPSDPNAKKTGGHLVYEGSLYVSAFSYYDGAGSQTGTHFRRPLNLSTSGQVAGPARVGTQKAGFVAGYMTTIPSEWRAAFGGPALTGHAGVAIASVQSNGPAASVFDPAQVTSTNPVAAKPVVGYPYGNSLPNQYGLSETSGTNPYFNLATQVRGIVFPDGTRSVLFFGRHGIGQYCYGGGSACNDPADSSQGTHAYPYKYQVWAYDANDLVAVKNGLKQQYQIKPYAVWNFSLPFEEYGDKHGIGGASYDPATKRIYISQQCQDTDCAPIIHAIKIVP